MTDKSGPSKYPILNESTHSIMFDGTAEWKHDKCGTVLMAAQVAHPIHDGLFTLSGSGEVRLETVPYCPTCEEKPSYHGKPITQRVV